MDVLQEQGRCVLFVDDEAVSRKWFAREFGDEFEVVTAAGADQALALLAEVGSRIAVMVTDYRMPERDGMKLLRAVQREHRHVIRLLATAYAHKEVAIAAVNEGKVMRILEKPLDSEATREALREALALHRAQALERAMNEGRVAALRETLGFLAHELNTPLATVRVCLSTMTARHLRSENGPEQRAAVFREDEPGELLAALERAERRALYCQSLISTFVQSARDAYPGSGPVSIKASSLVQSLMAEFPFDADERGWMSCAVDEDFSLPGRRDLLYLVLCTLAKNALQALRGRDSPRLVVQVGRNPVRGGQPCIRFSDNGPGIPAEILQRLTREPVTTRADRGGNGMGLLFCRRVMESIHGEIVVESDLGAGTRVTLYFRPD
jgi:two-component system response regulator PhcR